MRLGAASTASLVSQCQAHVVLSSSDVAALTSAGVGTGAAFLEHTGGVVEDVVGGVPAVAGAGPGAVSADHSTYSYDGVNLGLGPTTALGEGPVATQLHLDMNLGLLFIRFFHDIIMAPDKVNTSAITLAGADDADLWTYRLTNATAFEHVAYDRLGEATVAISLSKIDIDALKLADGAAGAAPLATSIFDTWVGLDDTLLRSADGTRNVARELGEAPLGAVASRIFVPDSTSPTVRRVDLDLDAGTLIFSMDEPVRASEVNALRVTIRAESTAADGKALTLTTVTAPGERGASATVTLVLGDADLDELKRIDHLATNRSTSWVAFEAFTFVDRSAKANPVAEMLMTAIQVSTYMADATAPVLESYSVDLERRTLELVFDEPVIITTFNASCLAFQEKVLSRDGQVFRPTPSTYIEDTMELDSTATIALKVMLGDDDYEAMNAFSHLAKSINSMRLTARPCAIVDVAGNELAEVYDGQGAAPSRFYPDSTPPEFTPVLKSTTAITHV